MINIKRRSEEQDRIEVIKLFDFVSYFGMRAHPNHVNWFIHNKYIIQFCTFAHKTSLVLIQVQKRSCRHVDVLFLEHSLSGIFSC